MITITNDFHNTEYRTRKTADEILTILDVAPWDRAEKDRRWANKVRNHLCGIKTCQCGNDIGARGAQNWLKPGDFI